MPKKKTRKSYLKRFKISAGGKITRFKQYGRHRRIHKTKRRTRTFAEPMKLNTKQTNIIKPLIS